MNQFSIVSRYHVFAFTLFAFTLFAYCVNNARSTDPVVPGRQFGLCFRLNDVQERTANERLGITENDTIHICRLKDSPQGFCLVTSTEGSQTPQCHEFNQRDAKITFMKPMGSTEMLVLRNRATRWNLSFTTASYDILRDLYINLTEQQDEYSTITIPIDLQKRDSPQSDFKTITARPMIIIDDDFDNRNVLHFVNAERNRREPVLVIMQGKLTAFSAEGDKVYLSLRDFPQETYFFTCSNPELAKYLGNYLGMFNEQGHAVPRN